MISKKIILLIAAITAGTIISLAIRQRMSQTQKIYSSQEAGQVIGNIYPGVDGYSIHQEERQMIENAGGNPTYGEITFEAVEQIINEFAQNLTEESTFYDLGAGTGKACMQVALCTPAKAVGIELSPTRYQAAQDAKKEIIDKNILTDENKLQFFEQNIVDTDLSNASVIFLCSTCFSNELMQTLSYKISKLQKPVVVITLKELPDPNHHFKQLKTYTLPMTWSKSTYVYTYELL